MPCWKGGDIVEIVSKLRSSSGFSETDQHSRKLSSFEYATKLFVPSLALIALILTQLIGKPPGLMWGLLVLALLSLGLGFYSPLRIRIHNRLERARNERVAASAFPELIKYVHRFGEFVDTRRADTLHYVVQGHLCEGNGTRYAQLGIPDITLWYGFWEHFCKRIDQQQSSVDDLQRALMEFHYLVGSYNNFCVAQIFDRLPQEYQSTMSSQARSSLNAFQQRFARFLANYEEFAKDLSASRPILQTLPSSFAHPKPLER